MNPIALSIGLAVLVLTCAVSICLLCRVRPTSTLMDAGKALATPLRALLHRDRGR